MLKTIALLSALLCFAKVETLAQLPEASDLPETHQFHSEEFPSWLGEYVDFNLEQIRYLDGAREIVSKAKKATYTQKSYPYKNSDSYLVAEFGKSGNLRWIYSYSGISFETLSGWCKERLDGHLYAIGNYENGQRNGLWVHFFQDTQVDRIALYDNGRIKGERFYDNGAEIEIPKRFNDFKNPWGNRYQDWECRVEGDKLFSWLSRRVYYTYGGKRPIGFELTIDSVGSTSIFINEESRPMLTDEVYQSLMAEIEMIKTCKPAYLYGDPYPSQIEFWVEPPVIHGN
jgi:hypothetical protein